MLTISGGVGVAAAVSSSYPMDPDAAGGGWNQSMLIEGRPQREGERPPLSNIRSVSPDYFKALGIPATLRYGAWETLNDQMQAHALDGMVVSVGTPTPFVAKLDADTRNEFLDRVLPPAQSSDS